jgi:5-methylcytosine-specific restriction endonuclease McrA
MLDNRLELDTMAGAQLWRAAGRSPEEYNHIMRVIGERAFISAVAPSSTQVAEWKARGVTWGGLRQHIIVMSGRIVTTDTAQRLWRLFSNNPEARRAKTIADFLAGFPERLKCRYCNNVTGPFHVDHCIALRKGGADDITNLQILCETCNLKKGPNLDPYRIYLEFEN